MESVTNILLKINTIADKLGYLFSWDNEEKEIQLWAKSHLFLVKINFMENHKAFVYIAIRGTWGRDGDLTDSIEFLTIYLLLRISKSSFCSPFLWKIAHPVVDGELYALCISFEQSISSYYNLDETFESNINELLIFLNLFEIGITNFFGCDQCSCKEKGLEQRYQEHIEWKNAVEWLFPEYIGAGLYSTVNDCPLYQYCYIEEYGATILANTGLSGVSNISNKFQTKEVDGITGHLLMSDELRNYISYEEKQIHSRLMNKFENNSGSICYYPGENYLISVGAQTLIMTPSNTSGKDGFEAERSKVQKKREGWTSLFTKNKYIWTKSIDDDLFERFCLDLLKKESGTVWARKAGHSKDSDFGKDIILEKYLTELSQEPNEIKPTFSHSKIVVQCKAYNKSVGKSQVQDIRDTVEFHDADGYMLIVSSLITSSLFDHLLQLRTKGSFLVEWWNRDEIEDRLDKHPELLKKYDTIVTLVK